MSDSPSDGGASDRGAARTSGRAGAATRARSAPSFASASHRNQPPTWTSCSFRHRSTAAAGSSSSSTARNRRRTRNRRSRAAGCSPAAPRAAPTPTRSLLMLSSGQKSGKCRPRRTAERRRNRSPGPVSGNSARSSQLAGLVVAAAASLSAELYSAALREGRRAGMEWKGKQPEPERCSRVE